MGIVVAARACGGGVGTLPLVSSRSTGCTLAAGGTGVAAATVTGCEAPRRSASASEVQARSRSGKRST